jgi:hypothetical protein
MQYPILVDNQSTIALACDLATHTTPAPNISTPNITFSVCYYWPELFGARTKVKWQNISVKEYWTGTAQHRDVFGRKQIAIDSKKLGSSKT